MKTTPEFRDHQTPNGGWGVALTIAALVLAFNLVLAPWTTLWDRDEPRFAQAAVEMVRSGNLLYPTFNGELRPDKPILIYWLMTLSVQAIGPSELAFRCWSALGGALACLFTFVIGRRILSARAGITAMLILASSPLFAVEAMAATTDAVLLAAITGAMAAFVVLLEAEGMNRILATLGLAAALAVGQLTKGPPGLVIPLLIMTGGLWFAGGANGRPPRIGLNIAAAAMFSLAVFAAWAVPANWATGGRLADAGIGHHVFRRMIEPLEGHGGHPLWYLGYYLPVVLIGFLPWIVHLPGSMRALVSGEIGGGWVRSLLLTWIVLPIVVFSLVASKLPHYLLPIWPALALAVAGTLDAARGGVLGGPTLTWLGGGVWLYGPVAGLVLIGVLVSAVMAPVGGLRGPAFVLVGTLAVVTAFGVYCQLRGRPWASTAVLVSAMLSAQAMIGLWFGPRIDRLKPVPGLAVAIRQATGAEIPVASHAFAEPSLVFYLGRSPLAVLPSRASVLAWAGEAGPGVLVIPRQVLDRVVVQHGDLPLTEIASSTGLNIGNGDWVDLVALGREFP